MPADLRRGREESLFLVENLKMTVPSFSLFYFFFIKKTLRI